MAAIVRMLCVIGAATTITVLFEAPARGATLPMPPTDTSYYVPDVVSQPGSAARNWGYNRGCAQGTIDRSRLGFTFSAVILDFGGVNSSESGTIATSNDGTTFSNLQITRAAKGFADGYYLCSSFNSVLTIGVGTNNSAYNVSAGGGGAWAKLVDQIATLVLTDPNGEASQVGIWSANDLEPGFHNGGGSYNWGKGFDAEQTSHGSALTRDLDYGSTDGCSETTHTNSPCNNGWDQHAEWALSWGFTTGRGAPEIYCQPPVAYPGNGGTDPSNAKQWTQIALYSFYTQHSTQHFGGPVDQNTAPVTPSACHISNTSSQAWSEFQQQLGSHAVTIPSQPMPWSLSFR